MLPGFTVLRGFSKGAIEKALRKYSRQFPLWNRGSLVSGTSAYADSLKAQKTFVDLCGTEWSSRNRRRSFVRRTAMAISFLASWYRIGCSSNVGQST
jgi:hypothetical protein